MCSIRLIHALLLRIAYGDAENAKNENTRHENAAPKIRGENGKKVKHENAGNENARHKNTRHEYTGKMNMRVRRMLKVMFTQ